MKKIAKLSLGIIAATALASCGDNNNRSFYISTTQSSGSGTVNVFVTNPGAIKGIVFSPNTSATPISYVVSGDVLGSCTFTAINDQGGSITSTGSGITHVNRDDFHESLEITCPTGAYTANISMNTRSGGFNYNGNTSISIVVA